ncbi:MAG: PhnD/SsuA/transferrin family substrate-binding protein [Thermodesulfobacteriota bacterium]
MRLLLLSGLLLAVGSGAATAEPSKVYSFVPDAPAVNLSWLKAGMEKAFGEAGFPVLFQPFARLKDFDRELKSAPPDLAILPGWYLDRPQQEPALRPLLRASRRGETVYRKVLIAAQDRPPGQPGQRACTVALTPGGSEVTELVAGLSVDGRPLEELRPSLVTVPKDSDALFAVTLGQVDLALVSEDNLTWLLGVNPRLAARVQRLASSPPLPLPVLCAVAGRLAPEQQARLADILSRMHDAPWRQPFVEGLQIDDWQKILP